MSAYRIAPRVLAMRCVAWYSSGMFLKVTRSGPRKYLQIMQAYRDPETGRPKQRYIGSLGRVDQLDRRDLDTLIDGLLKVTGRPTLGEIDRPAETILIGDNADDNHGARYLYKRSSSYLPARHNGGGNMGLCDGHAKWYSRETLLKSRAEGAPWRY